MKLLLDTHIFLWLNDQPEQLSVVALAACNNLENVLHISLISLWEIQVKSQLGKLQSRVSWQEMLKMQRAKNDLRTILLTEPHIEQLEHLEYHHRDPFDRMLIAQAQVERLSLVSADKAFAPYDVPVIW